MLACSPAPRWIAVGVADRRLLQFDARLRPTGELPLTSSPVALESTGDGASILVGEASEESGTVEWLRRANGAPVLQAAEAGPVRAMALDREGRRLFVLTAGERASLVTRRAGSLRGERFMSICPDPVSLVFTSDGDRAYVTCRPGAVVELDPRLGIAVRTVFVGADSGRACGAGRGALSHNGTLLFVPCARTGQVLYLDRVTLAPWDSVSVGPGATVLSVTPGAVAVTLLSDSDRVALVSLRSKTSVATLTAPNPVDVALSADGSVAYVAASGRNGAAGVLLAIDTRTGTERGRATLPPGARAVYVWPGRREARMYWGR